jgi:hypothetical protein
VTGIGAAIAGDGAGVRIRVQVQPRTSRTEGVGPHGGRRKVVAVAGVTRAEAERRLGAGAAP